jgi:hypothetical protein
MFKQPAFRYFPQFKTTALQDDTIFWKFALIPDTASVRRDANGRPFFLLVEYAFSDEDRAENPALPDGGGYMALDVELSISGEHEQAIVAALQQDVDDIWRRLKAAADAAGKPVQSARPSSWLYLGVDDVLFGLSADAPEAPPGDAPPRVIIDVPTWTKGTFLVSAPQSDALVSHRITEGPVSLVGSNVVSANMELTAAGATFMERTLTNPDGTGSTDLTPIQVVYKLEYLARVPPVDVSVTADSRNLYESVKSIYHDFEGNGCDEDSMVHSEANLEMAAQSGLIEVLLDPGTMSLSDDFIRELRSSALKTVQDQIKDNFFDKRPAPPPPADDKTSDFVTKEGDVYYFRHDLDVSSVHLGYHERLKGVQAWPAAPQGMIQTFLAGVPPQEMRRYVIKANLANPFFMSLGLTVTAFADWANEPIAFVECEVRYSGQDEDGQEVVKAHTFTLDADHPSGGWDPSLIGAKREYSYRWRVGYHDHPPSEYTDWQPEITPRLNLSIEDPGKVEVRFRAGNVNFGQTVRQAQVDVEYAAPGVPSEGTTLVLNAAQGEQTYQRYIYTTWNQPVRYRTRFYLQNDQTVESDWQTTTNRDLLVNEPSSYSRLDVQLVPAGDWADVVQSVVNLRYADAPYFSEGVFALKGIDEFRAWAVVLRDANKRKFQYQVITSFKDGTLARGEWVDADGDQTLPILVRSSPRLDVKLLPNLLDFAVTPVVTTTVRYDEPQGNVHHVNTFPFTAAQPATWTLPISDGHLRTYSHQTTYHTAGSGSVKGPEIRTDETTLVLEKLLVPEISCLVVPRPVDFVQTPVVEVDVSYKSPEDDIEFSDTLVFTEPVPQSFRFTVNDDSPRDYDVAVTYYLADGTVVARDPVTLDKAKIVVPKYVPAT